jgi:hypothetical protein
MNRLLLCFALLLLFANSYGDTADLNRNPLQWATGKRYERLGNPLGRGLIEGIVYAPPSVIDYASHILDGDPSAWWVDHTMEWTTFSSESIPERDSEIVTIGDRKDNALVFLIRPDRWIRLNSSESMNALNYVLQDNIQPFKTLDQFPWSRYIGALAHLYRGGPIRGVLSANFLNEYDKIGNSKFLLGTEKDIGVLRSLCIDPVVVRNDHDSKVVCNLITGLGSVERWTISFQFDPPADRSVKATKINIERIWPEGSFTCSFVD